MRRAVSEGRTASHHAFGVGGIERGLLDHAPGDAVEDDDGDDRDQRDDDSLDQHRPYSRHMKS